MPVTAETASTGEILSAAELGQRSHEAIQGMVGNLLTMPEFMTALGKTFFGRSFPHGGRAIIADGVFFRKGQFGYRIVSDSIAEAIAFRQEFQKNDSSILSNNHKSHHSEMYSKQNLCLLV